LGIYLQKIDMHLEFTTPPSLNKLFAGFPKRHKSDEYKNWITIASNELLTQTRYNITGDEWLEVNLTFFIPLYYKN
jgi:hypothetical protein